MSAQRTLTVLDLFSGIGGFSLGLERAGMRTIAFCEIEPFCRRVLAKHWPEVPCYDDVRTLTGKRLAADGYFPDVICGGFPCQDISIAGLGAGLSGARSGLWWEYHRIISEIRPAWVVIENVAALRTRGLDVVLSALDALGYVGEWHLIPASAIGAPHQRDRIWIVGNTDRPGRQGVCLEFGEGWQAVAETERPSEALAYPHGGGRREQGDVGSAFGDASAGQPCYRRAAGAVTSRTRLEIGEGTLREWAHAATTGDGWWAVEPDVGRVVDGPASRVDRRKRLIALGNSVVPQIPELIGRAILRAEASRPAVAA